MDIDRIKEIQSRTAYPDSVSVSTALLQVWNETEQSKTVSDAMAILRHELKDKTGGELYHAWMCNIKFAVFDAIGIDEERHTPLSMDILEGCEEGAKVFLDRLIKNE